MKKKRDIIFMSKKKKSRQISGEARTCFTGAAIALVIGLCCILYGNLFYNNVTSLDDVTTGATATVTSVEKVDRNLSPSEKKTEEGKGRSAEEIMYEYLVSYSVNDEGKEYTYSETRPYYDGGKNEPKVGDTDTINYAIVDGQIVVHPETKGANQFNITGWILVVLGAIAFGLGMFLKK